MQIAQQQAIRDKTSNLVLEWAASLRPPFTGETAEGFVEAITVAHLVADEGRLSLHRWIDAARRTGLSWTDIGNALGISKQAAQQRFKLMGAGEEFSFQDGEEIVRTRYSALNEMGILREEGQKGHELIRTDSRSLAFRRRIGFGSMKNEMKNEMERDGWTHVSCWPPLSYFKRSVPSE
jgi:hypothetical protein